MVENNRKIFGTDGIRGRANFAPMDSETALKLGRAVAGVFKNGSHRHRVVVGKDTRLSGYMIETALASGLCSMGADVQLLGPLPTPGIAFIARSMRADAGVVISASHNNFGDNGIKFFDREGYKLPDELELEIEKLVLSDAVDIERPSGEHVGRAIRIDDADGRYIQFLKDAFPNEYTLEGLRIVLDCANGAAYRVAPAVFEELGAEVIEIGTSPDGLNINQGLGSQYPQKMCELVVRIGANAGIALDGDGDRVIMCDEKGSVVNGDVIMALSADDMKRRGALTKDTLVATVMSNMALDRVMNERGVRVLRTRVGDRYVIAKMREEGFNLGGEQSGHIVFLDNNTTGDGIVGGLEVLSCMCKTEKPLSELAKIMEAYPQIKINVSVAKKKDFATIPEIVRTLESFKSELGREGRLLIRFSGTENIARVLVEGGDVSRIRSMANDIAGLIRTHMGEALPI